MTRRAHLVGAWPGRDPEHAMEAALKQLAPHLCCLTDGETGDRSQWATVQVDTFRANPDVEMLHDGGHTDYEDTPKWKVRDGVTLDPDTIPLKYALWFQSSYPSFRQLRARFDREDLSFQVGLVAPLDLGAYIFGPAAFQDPSIIQAFTVATVREIADIQARAGDDVIFQLETVVGLLAIAREPADQQAAAAERIAGGLLEVVRRAPAGTRFGFHLCMGDFHHKAYGKIADVRPVVVLANTLAANWPEGRVLEYVHGPFAAAAEPPEEAESFYEPLRDLALPDDVRFIAGFLHEKLDTDAHRELLARIERLAGRQVDVAASCGLGRRDTPEEALEAMREASVLVGEPAPASA